MNGTFKNLILSIPLHEHVDLILEAYHFLKLRPVRSPWGRPGGPGLSASQMTSRWSQMAPRWPLDNPQMIPRWSRHDSEMASWPQMASQMTSWGLLHDVSSVMCPPWWLLCDASSVMPPLWCLLHDASQWCLLGDASSQMPPPWCLLLDASRCLLDALSMMPPLWCLLQMPPPWCLLHDASSIMFHDVFSRNLCLGSYAWVIFAIRESYLSTMLPHQPYLFLWKDGWALFWPCQHARMSEWFSWG